MYAAFGLKEPVYLAVMRSSESYDDSKEVADDHTVVYIPTSRTSRFSTPMQHTTTSFASLGSVSVPEHIPLGYLD